MDTTIVTTPSGHQVTIKQGLTYGEQRQIQRLIASSMKVDPKTQEPTLDGGAVYDAQDLALKLLVTEIQSMNGQVTVTDPDTILDIVMHWPQADGEYLYAAIDKITKPQALKKGGSNSASTSSID